MRQLCSGGTEAGRAAGKSDRKVFTQSIEHYNLTLRIRIKCLARKTTCFSRSIELHEKFIGAFIEKYMFYTPGSSIDLLVTDHGIAVNTALP